MSDKMYKEADKQWEDKSVSAKYRQARSCIPGQLLDRLLEFIAEKLPKPLGTVLDVGCGTGQSTEMFSKHFQRTIGMDSSNSQIEQARNADRTGKIEYFVGSADSLPAEDASVDLITSIMAAHWFDHGKFAAEARRVLKPGGVLSIISYSDPQFQVKASPATDAGPVISNIVMNLRIGLTDDGWFHPKVHHLNNLYTDLDDTFTFTNGKDDLLLRNEKSLSLYRDQGLDSIMEWVATWSGVQHFSAANPDRDIVLETRKKIEDTLTEKGHSKDDTLEVEYPWYLLAYRKPI